MKKKNVTVVRKEIQVGLVTCILETKEFDNGKKSQMFKISGIDGYSTEKFIIPLKGFDIDINDFIIENTIVRYDDTEWNCEDVILCTDGVSTHNSLTISIMNKPIDDGYMEYIIGCSTFRALVEFNVARRKMVISTWDIRFPYKMTTSTLMYGHKTKILEKFIVSNVDEKPKKKGKRHK